MGGLLTNIWHGFYSLSLSLCLGGGKYADFVRAFYFIPVWIF